VFKGLPLDVVALNFELDGTFPVHEANPMVEANRRQLMEAVVSEGADLGIAWDGDTDRCFFIDDTGAFVPGDFVTGLLARRVLCDRPGGVVYYDLRASRFVRDAIEGAGGVARMSRVGHAFIKASMREDEAVFAGEVSGHYYFGRDDLYADNGWIPALMMLELLSEEGKILSEVLAPIRASYHLSGEINSTVADKDAVVRGLEERYGSGRVSKLDGLSVEFDDWWFNVRPSNTEPLLRLNLEARSRALMEKRRDEVLGAIRSG
jgi:phosphomannomutase